MNGNFKPINGGMGGGGHWKADGEGGITTDKPVTVNSSMTGKFIPRSETAENLDGVILESGEVAMATDRSQLRAGDGSAGGKIVFDREMASQIPGLVWNEFNPADIALGAFNGSFTAYGDGLFVHLKDSRFYTSANFHEWEQSEANDFNAASQLMYFNGAFFMCHMHMDTSGDMIIGNKLYKSTDGLTWDEVTDSESLLYIHFNGRVFLGYKSETNFTQTTYIRQVYTSTDMVNWTAGLDLSALHEESFTFGSGEGYFFYYYGDTIAASTDGVTWNQTIPESGKDIKAAVILNGYIYVLLENGYGLYKCEAGNLVSRTKIVTDTTNWYSILTSGDQLLITDVTGAPETGCSKVLMSNDGVSWHEVSNGYVGGSELIRIGPDFIACVHGSVPNGYLPVFSCNQEYQKRRVAPPNKLFGDYDFDGLILTSPDGSKFRLTVANNGTLSATAVV